MHSVEIDLGIGLNWVGLRWIGPDGKEVRHTWGING